MKTERGGFIYRICFHVFILPQPIQLRAVDIVMCVQDVNSVWKDKQIR